MVVPPAIAARVPGLSRLADLLASVRRTRGPSATARLSPGARLTVDLRDRIQKLMWLGLYEPASVALLRRLLRCGGTFIDVGAHIGYFAVLASATVGPKGRVYAFEADPELVEALRANLRPYPWAQTIHTAVMDTPGQSNLWRSTRAGESGWGSVLRPPDEQREAVGIPGERLDTLLSGRAMPRPVVLKVDVEGAELRVLAGAALVLRTAAAVLVEVNPACLSRDGVSPTELVAALRQAGFRVWTYPSAGRGPDDMLLGLREGTSVGRPPVWLNRIS